MKFNVSSKSFNDVRNYLKKYNLLNNTVTDPEIVSNLEALVLNAVPLIAEKVIDEEKENKYTQLILLYLYKKSDKVADFADYLQHLGVLKASEQELVRFKALKAICPESFLTEDGYLNKTDINHTLDVIAALNNTASIGQLYKQIVNAKDAKIYQSARNILEGRACLDEHAKLNLILADFEYNKKQIGSDLSKLTNSTRTKLYKLYNEIGISDEVKAKAMANLVYLQKSTSENPNARLLTVEKEEAAVHHNFYVKVNDQEYIDLFKDQSTLFIKNAALEMDKRAGKSLRPVVFAAEVGQKLPSRKVIYTLTALAIIGGILAIAVIVASHGIAMPVLAGIGHSLIAMAGGSASVAALTNSLLAITALTAACALTERLKAGAIKGFAVGAWNFLTAPFRNGRKKANKGVNSNVDRINEAIQNNPAAERLLDKDDAVAAEATAPKATVGQKLGKGIAYLSWPFRFVFHFLATPFKYVYKNHLSKSARVDKQDKLKQAKDLAEQNARIKAEQIQHWIDLDLIPGVKSVDPVQSKPVDPAQLQKEVEVVDKFRNIRKMKDGNEVDPKLNSRFANTLYAFNEKVKRQASHEAEIAESDKINASFKTIFNAAASEVARNDKEPGDAFKQVVGLFDKNELEAAVAQERNKLQSS